MPERVRTTSVNFAEEDMGGRCLSCPKLYFESVRQRVFSKVKQLQPLPIDLNSSLLPLYYISKVLGLTCCNVKIENEQVHYCYSFRGIIYNLLLIFVVLSLLIYIRVMTFFWPENYMYEYSSIMMINDILKVTVPIFLTLASLMSALKQKDFLSCLLNLEKVDSILIRFNIKIPYQTNRRFLIYLLISGMIIISVMVCSDTVLLLITLPDVDALYMAVYTLPKYLNYVSECQFLAWVFALKQRYRLLNERLLESGHHDEALILALSTAHASLCSIADDVNALFSVQMLVRIAFYFVEILANFFFGMQTLPHLVDREFIPRYYVCCIIYWTFWVTVELVSICAACSTLKKEARRTGIAVHAVQRKASNVAVKEQLQLFSSQLIHQQVSFTACDLFHIDLLLVHARTCFRRLPEGDVVLRNIAIFKVFGTVTTYVVILVQFNKEFSRLGLKELNRTVTNP